MPNSMPKVDFQKSMKSVNELHIQRMTAVIRNILNEESPSVLDKPEEESFSDFLLRKDKIQTDKLRDIRYSLSDMFIRHIDNTLLACHLSD